MKTGDCYRADHLLEGTLEAALEDTKAPLSKEAAYVRRAGEAGDGGLPAGATAADAAGSCCCGGSVCALAEALQVHHPVPSPASPS